MNATNNAVGSDGDFVTNCSLCNKSIWFRDSWSPYDEAICAECDTIVTGREHEPTIEID